MVDHQCVRKCTESVGGWTTGPTCFWNIQSVLSCWKQVLQPASREAKVKTQSQIETAEDGGDGFGKARPLAPTYGHLVLCEFGGDVPANLCAEEGDFHHEGG